MLSFVYELISNSAYIVSLWSLYERNPAQNDTYVCDTALLLYNDKGCFTPSTLPIFLCGTYCAMFPLQCCPVNAHAIKFATSLSCQIHETCIRVCACAKYSKTCYVMLVCRIINCWRQLQLVPFECTTNPDWKYHLMTGPDLKGIRTEFLRDADIVFVQ